MQLTFHDTKQLGFAIRITISTIETTTNCVSLPRHTLEGLSWLSKGMEIICWLPVIQKLHDHHS